jgi:polyribonucleotide nucleotidyltransferase
VARSRRADFSGCVIGVVRHAQAIIGSVRSCSICISTLSDLGAGGSARLVLIAPVAAIADFTTNAARTLVVVLAGAIR